MPSSASWSARIDACRSFSRISSRRSQKPAHARAEETLNELLALRADKTTYATPLDLATAYAGIGDADAALAALEQAREERSALLWGRIHFPDFNHLRGDPRWQTLAARLRRSAPVQLPTRTTS